MSITSKHAYRFEFLKSEKWQLVRTEALARDDAKCYVCGLRSLANDAHHLFYRKRWNETASGDLVTLCRNCHELMHVLTAPKSECEKKKSVEDFQFAKGLVQSIHSLLGEEKLRSFGCTICKRQTDLEMMTLFPEMPFSIEGNRPRPICQRCKKKLDVVTKNGLFKDCKRSRDCWIVLRKVK